MWGDGIVPVPAAHLSGATQLDLDGVYHSPLGAAEVPYSPCEQLDFVYRPCVIVYLRLRLSPTLVADDWWYCHCCVAAARAGTKPLAQLQQV